MGDGLWVPVAVPSVGVLCFRAWWEASSESLQVFGDASRLHDLKRPSLFRRDKVPARNTHKIVRLRLYALKKVFEGSKGRFFKNAPLAGCGTASHKERASQPIGARLFRGETQEKADLTGMVKFAILYTRDEWITHNKKRMQFFLREGKKSEQAV